MAQLYTIKAVHIAEKLRLRDLRDRFTQPASEFSNYELVIQYAEDSFLFLYNYGVAVFFNVPDNLQVKELGAIQEYHLSSDHSRAGDVFLLEVQTSPQGLPAKVYFDRVIVDQLSPQVIKLVSILLAESTALEYYEILIEDLLVKTNAFSKILKHQGKLLVKSQELLKFIGLCMDTKQEIISNLYIVDSPDEAWESVEWDRVHQDLKQMLEIDTRYRALDYKIRIIQEGVSLIVELMKSKRETLLELTIILLISFEIILSLIKWHWN